MRDSTVVDVHTVLLLVIGEQEHEIAGVYNQEEHSIVEADY